MDWADELAAGLEGPQVINDSKTPSGTVHVGSLRGPVILDVIARALRARGLPTTLLYGIDDLDPMDAQSLLTPNAVAHEMGRPLAHVPDQAGSCHASYAQHHTQAFIETFAALGISPDRYYAMSELYSAGTLDPYIRRALDEAQAVRDIYARLRSSVAGRAGHPADWHPLQVICESCGRVGTTIVTSWDGMSVAYECRPGLVDWATGCGHAGSCSPFGGSAKLPWNLEWAAQWGIFGVTIEPCGKDLSSAGGSRDRSDAIAQEVFGITPPLNLAYEFLNIGGKKMSSSRGLGVAAHEIAAVVPADVLRLLFLRARPASAIEFDPQGSDAIPRLFDEFDRLAQAAAGLEVRGSLPADHEAMFAHTQPSDEPAAIALSAAAFRLPFGQVAFLSQQPDVDLTAHAAAEKGAPLTSLESELLTTRAAAARSWLDTYAPESARIEVRLDALPPEASDLTPAQRTYLAALAAATAGSNPSNGSAWQELIFETMRALDLSAGQAFGALYLAFLGRISGPRAGWLLASLDPTFVQARLLEAGAPA